MSFALNEVEAIAKKAARGAGYSWGLAEEAAKATRWLCAQGIDGSAVLARLLGHGHASDLAAHTPGDLSVPWGAQNDLCALISGAALSDRANGLTSGNITLKNVTEPAMLLPFAAQAARQINATVTLNCDDVTAVTNGTGISVFGDFPTSASEVTVSVSGALTDVQPLKTRATPDPDDWAKLNRFAHLTYAPATEESRLLGAGAGLSDND